MLGDEQLHWLLDGLRRSTATFKFVVNGSQMINPVVNYEGFGDYPEEQSRLLGAVAAEGLDGVVFLSGDRHQGELLRVEREGAAPWYELTSSPLTGSVPAADLDGDHPARVPGTHVLQRNFGRVAVSGPAGARVLELSLHDVEGEALWVNHVEAAELVTP